MKNWSKSVSKFWRPKRSASGKNLLARPYFYLGDGLALTRLNSGHFIYVDPLEESVCAHLIAHGTWEPWIAKVVLSLLAPGDRVVEVGGHVGFYTIAMAHSVGPRGSVLSFEANPRLAALAAKSVRINGYAPWVQIVQKVVSDTVGTLKFSISRQYGGGGHVYVGDNALGVDTQVLEVEAIRLDDLNLPKVRLLRIDAEGSEPLILSGAHALLQQPDIILCMEWDVVQMRSRADPQEVAARLGLMGFRFWRITTKAELLPVKADDLGDLASCDLIVARSDPFSRVGMR
ncbi:MULTISPECIES: FkbM family methyltransferase [unclassified Brevundimonas]|uniref:FkbM family methyltransferase n=1 Tax=unclassified Brevundimonas TaxID=2622653 RepID=UPI0020049604|nr:MULTISPECIES: FkbM family methyltransferase [unclassified Brevundimonas]MCK6104983.1 FkbM family methyltransferase [Brevundimonas sp. EYE_349]MCW0046922.1 FkbM family methyltransferase [Brevundimonas sp. BT-123]